jgi:hypothetical protein
MIEGIEEFEVLATRPGFHVYSTHVSPRWFYQDVQWMEAQVELYYSIGNIYCFCKPIMIYLPLAGIDGDLPWRWDIGNRGYFTTCFSWILC